MMDFKKHFSLAKDEIYFNCAAQGPLRKASSDAFLEGVKDKQNPSHMDMAYGALRAQRCREAISKLIDCSVDHIALADSTSWGVNLIARGLELKAGDEVLAFDGQFPSNVAPWEFLSSKGISLKKIQTKDFLSDVSLLEKNIGSKTKIACLEWVHWISGDRIPLKEMIDVCQRKNILVVVDITQGLGAIPFSMKDFPVDAVFCSGYKWLLSPYGSGFFALSDKLLSLLEPCSINWLCFPSVMEGRISQYEIDFCKTARKFDVFSHMGFLNIDGLTAAVNWLATIDLQSAFEETLVLHQELSSALNPEIFSKLNTGLKERQSLISTFKIQKKNPQNLINVFKQNKIFATIRDGNVRFSPHFYNDLDQVKFVAEKANSI